MISEVHRSEQDDIVDEGIQLIRSEHSFHVNINDDVMNDWIRRHNFWTKFRRRCLNADVETYWISAHVQLKEQHLERAIDITVT